MTGPKSGPESGPRSGPKSGVAWRKVLVGLAVLAVVAVFVASLWGNQPLHHWLSSQFQSRSAVGGPFQLVDTAATRFTNRDLLGKPFGIAFGFTHCPDVCPTTLQEMSNWLHDLGPAADRLRFVFVSIDPKRDTPAVLASYLEAFDSRIAGLTGTVAEVEAMRRSYGAHARQVPLAGGDYTMDHATSVFLFDSKGHFVELIKFGEAGEMALAKLHRLASAASAS